MHNFIEGIDVISDPTGETALPSHVFFSANGINTNDGTPQSPRNSIDSSSVSGFTHAVLGDDRLFSQLLTPIIYIGDGFAYLQGDFVEPLWNGNFVTDSIGMKNIHFNGYAESIVGYESVDPIENCIFENIQGLSLRNRSNGVFVGIISCFFKGIDVNISNRGFRDMAGVERCIFWANGRSRFEFDSIEQDGRTATVKSCVFINQDIITTTDHIENFQFNYYENCIFDIDGTSFGSLEDVRSVYPNAFQNDITGNPLFKGSFQRNEFRVVNFNSSLLGSGFGGVNVGGVSIGAVFNLNNPNTIFNNTRFNGQDLVIITGDTGSVTFEPVQLDRVVNNPSLFLNGFSDFINNTFRITNLQSPNKLTCSLQIADIDGNFMPFRSYKYGVIMGEDFNGLTSGDDQYHGFDLNTEIRIKFIRLTIEIRN